MIKGGKGIIKMELGKGLERLRLMRGWTQKETAEKLHTDPANYNRWEKNNATPSFDTVENIADLFGVTLDELFEYKQKNENRDSPLKYAIAKLKDMKINIKY